MCVPLLRDTEPLRKVFITWPRWRVQSPVPNSTMAGLAWLQQKVCVHSPDLPEPRAGPKGQTQLIAFPLDPHPEELFQQAEAQSNAHAGFRSFSTTLMSTSSLQTSLRTTTQCQNTAISPISQAEGADIPYVPDLSSAPSHLNSTEIIQSCSELHQTHSGSS